MTAPLRHTLSTFLRALGIHDVRGLSLSAVNAADASTPCIKPIPHVESGTHSQPRM